MKNDGHAWADIIEKIKDSFPNLSQMQIYEKARKYYKSANGGSVKPKVKDGNEKSDSYPTTTSIEHKSDGSVTFNGIVELMDGQAITPDIIMRAHNLDPVAWDVLSYKTNFWQAQAKGGKKMLLYQSKIVVKPKKNELSIQDIENHFKKFSKKYKPSHSVPIKNVKSDKMLEINVCDLHLAKLGMSSECGESYDSEIAKSRFEHIIDSECRRLDSLDVEQILFVWCNDFFNSDGPSGATTAGTPQSNDMGWQKMFMVGVEMLVSAIDKLQQYAPVKTFYIASNHARATEFYALNYISAWFRDNDRVDVDVNFKSRYYYQYGVNLIGFSHGSYEKKDNLMGLMSVEVPEMWSSSTYREYHLAHKHCEEVVEKNGIVFRRLPSMTGTDNWHYDSGYVGASKRSYSFLWDKKMKLECINIVHTELS